MNQLSLSIGAAIVRLRSGRGLSQERLAIEAAVDRRYLSDLENGKRNPSVEVVARLAGYFGLSPAQFFELTAPLSLSDVKDRLCEAGADDAVVFESPDYATAFIGVSHDGRAVYAFDAMVASLIAEGMQPDEAIEFIDYNTLRALPYMDDKAPVIVYR